MFICCMKTVKDAFSLFKPELHKIYDPEETEALILLVLNEVTGYTKAKLKAFPENELSENESERLKHILKRLLTGEPIQYILGHTEFYGLTFQVNPSVLIPRPETEELVSWILESTDTSPYTILDIGTGSGCIPVAIKIKQSENKLFAVDISTEALKTAEVNARANNAEVTFIQADILDATTLHFNTKFDIIVSNPPYVTETDKRQMHRNVTNFEPHTALFVPENDPLLFYKAIADFAIGNLNNNGLLFFEINESYGKQTVEMLAEKRFKNIDLRKDMSGRDRMIRAVWKS